MARNNQQPYSRSNDVTIKDTVVDSTAVFQRGLNNAVKEKLAPKYK